MIKGELSSEAAPTILFHYSFLFAEKKKWWKTTLSWREEHRAEFSRWLGVDWVNVAVLATKTQRKAVEKELGDTPFRCIYLYETRDDIKALAQQPWRRIWRYYDEDGGRGSLFGAEAWKSSLKDP